MVKYNSCNSCLRDASMNLSDWMDSSLNRYLARCHGDTRKSKNRVGGRVLLCARYFLVLINTSPKRIIKHCF